MFLLVLGMFAILTGSIRPVRFGQNGSDWNIHSGGNVYIEKVPDFGPSSLQYSAFIHSSFLWIKYANPNCQKPTKTHSLE